MHYLLIGMMISLNHLGEVLMVSTLICIITHLIRPMVSYAIRRLNIYDSSNCYTVLLLNFEIILSLCRS